jgi:hypothetical protein
MPNYKEDTVTSVQGYIERVDQEKIAAERSGNKVDFLFRGQSRDLPLLPKLARLKLRGSIENIEKLIINEFRRTSLPLSEFQPRDEWDLLALAQHHGLPTRLLDWTFNALAALWFAVKEPPHKNEAGVLQQGVVWIFVPELSDYRTDTEQFAPLSNKITKIFRPTVITRRISAQAAAFTVHKINNGGRVVQFEKHKRFSTKLIKLNILPGNFSEMRQRLHILGVNNATVFPDIDGLCKHLEWRHSYLGDEV